ncbi:MAG: AAA family ATPase, partial [Duodenibacillus sp.]|nr:AAA family ATPase [Duodenibacillus sp.]
MRDLAHDNDKQGSAPIILERGKRLYWQRSYEGELELAGRIAELARECSASRAEDLRERAVETACGSRFAVISGGPGTGKTTVIVRILSRLLEENAARGGAPLRILLAAPTGKAAGRMQQAVRNGAQAPGMHPACRELEASTIHKLLAAGGGKGKPGPGNPLDCDALVIDEGSMVDIKLAEQLFAAIDAERTRVIILGDMHQLEAVGPGSVFADLSSQAEDAPLRGCVVHFTKSYRFSPDKNIGRLSGLINAGSPVIDELRAMSGRADPDDNAVAWDAGEARGRLGLTPAAEAWLEKYAGAVWLGMKDRLLARPASEDALESLAAELWERFSGWGVLAAQRRGPMSLAAVTGFMRKLLQEEGFPGEAWQPVIVRANDESVGVHNGDVGIIVPALDKNGRDRVYFGGDRWCHLGLLPEHEPAFAITIHQSQGSEYGHVAVLLPA